MRALKQKTASGQYSLQEAKVGPVTALALYVMDNVVIPQLLCEHELKCLI